MTFLTDEKIIDCIAEYINDSKYNYAVLLDGEWGSGKTHFTKEVMIPYLDNKEKEKNEKDKEYIPKKNIYISLYGISSKDDIIKQIWLQTIPFKESSFLKRIKPYSDKASTLAKTVLIGGLSYFNVTLPKVDFEKLVDLDKCVLFFDDIERCNMNINEILGYINNFVEHNGVKTIIIANEKEIGKLNITSNLELKYLLALQDRIEFPNEKIQNDGFMTKSNDEKSTQLSIDRISSRVEYIFGENFIYNQIKEKLIGITINYRPDITRTFDILTVANFSDNCLRESIISLKEFVIESLKNYNHINLRTLQFSFEKYKKIGEVIAKLNMDYEFKARVLKEVYKYVFILAIKVKQGEKMSSWSEGSEYGTKDLGSETGQLEYIFGFRFVDEFILYSNFDEQSIVSTVMRYYDDTFKQATDKNDPLNILSNMWWELEDNTLLGYVSQINDKIKRNLYDFSLYSKIIKLYLVFRKIGLAVKIEEVLLLMKNNINNLEEQSRVIFDNFGVIVDEDIVDDFNKYIGELNASINIKNANMNMSSINLCFEYSLGWADSFYKYVSEEQDKFLRNGKFFYLINIDKAFDCIKQSNSHEITLFRQAIQRVYNFENIRTYYIHDIDNLKDFSNKVSELSSKDNIGGAIRRNNLKLLEKQINSYIKKLSGD
jgi:hypothetical protein